MKQFMAFILLSVTIFLPPSRLTLGSGQNPSAPSACKSRIAFGVDRIDEMRDSIYTINADGEGLTQVIRADLADGLWDLAWSPDGNQIGFFRSVGDNEAILPYTVNANGTGLQQLVDNTEFNYWEFEWSPDGQWILSMAHEEGNFNTDEIHLINFDNHKLVKIKSPNDNRVWNAAWSPDGKKIALSSGPVGQETADIYRIAVDDVFKGAPVSFINLTKDDYDSVYPTWSPMGDKIAFSSNHHGNYDIYVMNDDGSNLVRLTSDSKDELVPKWSPDNQIIAFRSSGDLYVMNRDGTDPRMIYSGIGDFEWSPDGTEMVVSTRQYPEDRFETLLKIINIDTGDVTDLGVGAIDQLQLIGNVEWSPCIQ